MTFFYGASRTTQLLISSQAILSMQSSFAVFPLVMFTSDKLQMGEFVNSLWRKILACVVIASLNALLPTQIFSDWLMT